VALARVWAVLAFAHGTTGEKRTVGVCPPPQYIKISKKKKKKKRKALQYCDSNEFIELTVGTSRVLMSKAATNNICSNKHKHNVNIHMLTPKHISIG
jgi:hypothetical protein